MYTNLLFYKWDALIETCLLSEHSLKKKLVTMLYKVFLFEKLIVP
jgi:hypothetical protein